MKRAVLKRRGREHAEKPSKVRALTDDFVREFEDGATDEDACHLIGLHSSTYYAWMRKGEDYIRHLSGEQEGDPIEQHRKFYEFWRAVMKAKARYKRGMTGYLNEYRTVAFDPKVGFLVLEVLSRRDRRNWAREAPMDTGGAEQFSPDDQFL